MANANIARGLMPYRHYDGSYWNGSGNVYFVPSTYATALFIGDPVDIASASNDANGVPAVTIAASGTPFIGSVIGIVNGGYPQITVTRDLAIYRVASVAQYILVSDDPTLLYMIQDDASAQATAPKLWPGKNANLVTGTGSTITGYSGWQLAASTVATTSTLDVKIMRSLDQADNAIGTAANTNMNAKWLVKMNNSRLSYQTAGV